MKNLFLIFSLLFSSFAMAQVVVTEGETKILKIFYVKEGTNSPYQGLLQFDAKETIPSDLKTKQLEQYQAWKLAVEELKNKPIVELTVDEKVAQVKALRLEADNIASDPAVAAKLEAAPVVKVK